MSKHYGLKFILQFPEQVNQNSLLILTDAAQCKTGSSRRAIQVKALGNMAASIALSFKLLRWLDVPIKFDQVRIYQFNGQDIPLADRMD